jgi:proteasome lid subunit RPN8/RPN11
MHTRIKQTIISLAKANPSEEVCGFIYLTASSVEVYPCRNVTQDEAGPARTFEIDPQEYIAASHLGSIIGIYHSHSLGGSGAAFSEEDLEVAREMELPFYLYSVEADAWASYIPPSYRVPLSGRMWQWGVNDCYETVRIYFRQERGVYLSDYDRDETFEHSGESAITQYIKGEGFEWLPKGSPYQKDDVLLFKTPGSAYPHHLAVFLGRSQVLHHPRGELSRVEPLNGNWLKRVAGVLRYVGKPSVSETV